MTVTDPWELVGELSRQLDAALERSLRLDAELERVQVEDGVVVTHRLSMALHGRGRSWLDSAKVAMDAADQAGTHV